jgi:hypothetical protein
MPTLADKFGATNNQTLAGKSSAPAPAPTKSIGDIIRDAYVQPAIGMAKGLGSRIATTPWI